VSRASFILASDIESHPTLSYQRLVSISRQNQCELFCCAAGITGPLRQSLPLGRFPPVLQPSIEALFFFRTWLGLTTQLRNEIEPGLGKPGHPVRNAAVFSPCRSLPAPIVDFNPRLFPVPHGIPVNSFVRPQVLPGTQTRIAPESAILLKPGKIPVAMHFLLDRAARTRRMRPVGSRFFTSARTRSTL